MIVCRLRTRTKVTATPYAKRKPRARERVPGFFVGGCPREANRYRNRSLSPTTEEHMPKILVIHGAGMNMRGKVKVDIFGPMTLPEYDERIRGYAKELGVDVEIFHSNVEGEIVNRLYAA